MLSSHSTAVRSFARLTRCSNSAAHRRWASSSDTAAIPTTLFDFHKEHTGDMVPFAGYSLPVLYKDIGVMKEHLWCREKASLFDVSHMGQIRWTGADRMKVLERLVVSDIAGLAVNQACLSLVTNAEGGILDDTVITQESENSVYMVVNGATKHDDMKHFQTVMANEFASADVQMEYLGDDVQLLALQGPSAAAVVATLLPDSINLDTMPFMSGIATTIDGIEGCRVTRCGYTGEDGFELSMPAEHAISIANRLLESPHVKLAGLGARDSLRLEAGLCLYGNDLDATTTPIEGVLGWTLGPPKSRRRVEGGFIGADKILTPEGKFQKVARKRVGIMGMKAPARGSTEIYDATGETMIGTITSGTFSPCLKKPIAIGYVQTPFAKAGTEIHVKVRGKLQAAQITKMPFVESRYYRVPE